MLYRPTLQFKRKRGPDLKKEDWYDLLGKNKEDLGNKNNKCVAMKREIES